MGIPEPLSGRREFPEAATLGSVLHALLEHSLVEPDADALRLWRVEASKAGANEEQIASGEAPLLEHLKVCRASKPLSNALAADGYCELGFSLKSHNLEISGVIDRLWWDEENQHWCVLDYKSGGESKPTAEDAFEPQHLTQLAAYAWAAEKILAGQNAGAVGPLQVCATATGELHEIGAWNPAAQQQFQSLLDSISVCSKSAWEDVLEDSRSTQSPRPCQQCGYYKQGCPGKA